jgi:hypothetical protein
MGLVAAFTGRDPAIAKGEQRLCESEDAPRSETGIDGEMFGLIQRADAARKAG